MTSLPSLTSTSIPSLFELCISVIAQTNQVFASVYVPKTILETIFDVAKENGFLNKNNFLHFINADLEHVDLRGIHSLHDDDILVLVQRCHQLKSLKLDSFVTQQSLEYIAQNCTTLEKLDLRNQRITNVKGLLAHPMSQLTSLTICGDLSPTSFEEIITTYTNLKVLKMDTLNDLTLSNSTRTLPHLEELKLWYSHNKTTSNLSTQSRKTTNLTSKRKIYPLHMFALTCCPSLKSLELHKWMDYDSTVIDKKLLCSLNCTNLRRLVLRSNFSIHFDHLPSLFQRCPNLQIVEGLGVTFKHSRKIQIFPTIECHSSLFYFTDMKQYMDVLFQWKPKSRNQRHPRHRIYPQNDDNDFEFYHQSIVTNNTKNENNTSFPVFSGVYHQCTTENGVFGHNGNNTNNNNRPNNNNRYVENFNDDNHNNNNNIPILRHRNPTGPGRRLLYQRRLFVQYRQRQQIPFANDDTDNNNEQNSQQIEFFRLEDPSELDIDEDMIDFGVNDNDLDPLLNNDIFLTNPFNISKMFLFSTPLRNAVQNNLVKELHLIKCSIPSYKTIVTTYPNLELLDIQDVITEQRTPQGEIVQFSSLKKLVFSGSDFNDICPICPTITELVVDIDSIATRNTIVLSKILQHFPHVNTLKCEKRRSTIFFMGHHSVTFKLWDTDEFAPRNEELQSSFTTLESLFLVGCKIPQDANFSILNRLKQLKMLNCRVECDICLGPAMERFICNLGSRSQNPLHITIRTQKLSRFECNQPLDYETLSALLTQKRLSTLKLHSAPFSREMLEYLLTKQLSLTNFQCRIDVELDTALMCQLITRWPSLKFSQQRLDFASQFRQVTTEQFKKIYVATDSVVYLDLSHCTQLTSDILSLPRLRQLQVLKLNFVNFVVEMETLPRTLIHFEAVGCHLQLLCKNLFIWRFQEWPSLKIFKIAGAKGVYLDKIICPQFQQHNLEDLDVCGLDFSDGHVEGVLKMFPKLQRLNVTGCSLSEDSLVRLRNAVKCVITDMNTCPTSKITTNQHQTNNSHSPQTLQECDDFQYLDITEYSVDPSKPLVRLQIKLFDDHTILKVLFNEHHTPQHVYALVQRACRWGDQAFDLYCYPNKLLSQTDSRTLGELKLNNCLLMQKIRKLTEDEKKFLEDRHLMKLKISWLQKQTHSTQNNEKQSEHFTKEERSTDESEQDEAVEETGDDFWLFENNDIDNFIYDEEKAIQQAIKNESHTLRRKREDEEKQPKEKIRKIYEESSHKNEDDSSTKQQNESQMFKENTRNVSREWQQPQVENDVNNVPFTVERSDMRRGHGCDDEDDPLLQIAIAESTNINRQQNTTQMDIDMSSTNSSHLNNYSVSDLTEEEQLALALSLSTQDFEAKQRTDE